MTATVFGSLAFCTIVGFGAAWLILGKRMESLVRSLESAKPKPLEQRPEVKDLLQHILDVTTQLDGDVGRHSHRLNEVQDGLRESLDHQPSAVVEMTQKLLEANVQLRNELQVARTQIAQKQHELETYVSEARTDILTGLQNRRSFNEEINRQFAQRQRQRITFSMLMIDVDHFKNFNDTHGHLAGDLVLRAVARMLSNTLREMDIVCRYGGEEFAVICPGSTLAQAAAGAERVRAAIEAEVITLKEGPVRVTISIGVAEVDETEIAEGLIQRADNALYAAKRAGRNQIQLHQVGGFTETTDAGFPIFRGDA